MSFPCSYSQQTESLLINAPLYWPIYYLFYRYKENASRVVRQDHYTCWPDDGSPDTGTGLIDLIGQVQGWQQPSGNSRIVVDWKYVWARLSVIYEWQDKRDCQFQAIDDPFYKLPGNTVFFRLTNVQQVNDVYKTLVKMLFLGRHAALNMLFAGYALVF